MDEKFGSSGAMVEVVLVLFCPYFETGRDCTNDWVAVFYLWDTFVRANSSLAF